MCAHCKPRIDQTGGGVLTSSCACTSITSVVTTRGFELQGVRAHFAHDEHGLHDNAAFACFAGAVQLRDAAPTFVAEPMHVEWPIAGACRLCAAAAFMLHADVLHI